MTGLFDNVISTEEKIAALEREIAMRRRVYPNRVAEKKMTQQKADYELRVMEQILADLRRQKT